MIEKIRKRLMETERPADKQVGKPAMLRLLNEQDQAHQTRVEHFVELEEALGRPVVSYFTSFRFPVSIEDSDADLLEGILQGLDLSRGFALFVSSPGGDGLASERIINICRSYSGTGEYWAVVPGKAKSAATMICLGASQILMDTTAELGPIDPQLTLIKEGIPQRFSAVNVVESYDDLFARAVRETGNLEPYMQQLANYDEREIKEYRAAIELSEDIAVRTLSTGMMKGVPDDEIKERIGTFLSLERTKTHGRPIYAQEALSCGLNIDVVDVRSTLWERINELYLRTDSYVSTRVAKCVESKNHSFYTYAPPQR